MQNLSRIFADLDGANSVDPSVRTCHVCLATVSSIRTYCTSCGHPLCKTCTCPIPEGADESHKAFEDSGGVHLTIRDGETLTSYNRSVPPSPVKESANSLEASDVGTSLRNRNTVKEQELGQSSARQVITTTSQPKPGGSRASSVKDNPFIVADRLTANEPSTSKPVTKTQATRKGAAPSECVSRRSDSEHMDEHCSDPACRATHPGHQPYRHSVSCSELRSTYSADETSTDNPQQTEHYASHHEHHGRDTSKPACHEHRADDLRHEERHGRHVKEPVDQGDHREYRNYSWDRSGPKTYDSRRTETHERYHKHPHSHSPDDGPSRRESHRHGEYREEVRPQESRPRSRFRSPPDWLRGQTSRPREQMKSHRSYRPSSSPHRYEADEEIGKEDFRDVRRRLSPHKAKDPSRSHYSRLPKESRARIAHRDAEKSLRKIRSEARILLSTISEPEEESMETTTRRGRTFRDYKPAGISVPSSVTSLTRESSLERPRLSAKDKGKHRADATTLDQSESQRPSKPHHTVTEKGYSHQHEQRSKSKTHQSASREKDKTKETTQKQSEVPHSARAPTQQHSSKSHQPPAERGGEHQCDWKDKYETLKTEIEDGRQGQDFGISEAGHDHHCDWKEKYLALKPEVVDDQGQQADLGLEGLTIVLHMRGKDDLVINTDLRELDQQ